MSDILRKAIDNCATSIRNLADRRRAEETLPMNPTTLTTDAAQRVAQHSLARLGWEIRVADVNLTTETVRLTLASTCGRLVTLDARGGKASVTREQTERYTVSIGRRGDKAIVERIRTRLLGRTKFDCGARTAMRMFANYLADNSPVAQVEAGDARNAVRLLMGAAS